MTNNEPNAKLLRCPKCGADGDTFTRYAKSSCYAADCPAHERALNTTGVDAQGVVADVIWRIDNEAAQFIDKEGMVYLRYLRDLLANQRPAPTSLDAAGKVERLVAVVRKFDALFQPNDVSHMADTQPDAQGIYGVNGASITLGDFRELRAALAALAEGNGE